MQCAKKFHHAVMKFFLVSVGFAPSAVMAVLLEAATPTNIHMSIVGGCEFSNTTIQQSTIVVGTMNFGSIYNTASPVDTTSAAGQGSIQLRCTPGVSATATMNQGLYALSVVDRRMKRTNSDHYLAYQLYTTAARNIIWDATTGHSLTFSNDAVQTMTVYGRLPAQNSVLPGTYTDTVTITITW